MNSVEQTAHNRFVTLIEKVTNYIETPGVVNSVKAAAYEEIWQILREHQSNQWSCVVHQVIDNWTEGESKRLLEIVRYLVQRGADIQSSRDYYLGSAPSLRTPLWLAVKSKDPKLLKFLLKSGARGGRDLFEEIVLTWSAPPWSPNEERCVKWLLKFNIELPQSGGLYLANERGNIWAIHTLAKQVELTRENKRLERELEKAQEWIIALECRPPGLGGPAYETGKAEWDARKNLSIQ